MSNSQTGSHKKEALFFGSEGQARYAMAHRPSTETDKAVIFCPPFADEVQRSYRPLYNFAEELAEAGYLAFRLEYRGCGDSQGNHLGTNLTTRLEDIAEAITFVKKKYGVARVGLLGLRLGASIAMTYAAQDDSIGALILWEPVVDGRKHLYDGLRSNITTQTFVYQKVLHNRDQLIENMRRGEPLWIDGYEIDEQLFDQICQMDVLRAAADIKVPALVVNMVPPSKSETVRVDESIKQLADTVRDSSHVVVREAPFWMNKRVYIPSSPELSKATLDWLRARF